MGTHARSGTQRDPTSQFWATSRFLWDLGKFGLLLGRKSVLPRQLAKCFWVGDNRGYCYKTFNVCRRALWFGYMSSVDHFTSKNVNFRFCAIWRHDVIHVKFCHKTSLCDILLPFGFEIKLFFALSPTVTETTWKMLLWDQLPVSCNLTPWRRRRQILPHYIPIW